MTFSPLASPNVADYSFGGIRTSTRMVAWSRRLLGGLVTAVWLCTGAAAQQSPPVGFPDLSSGDVGWIGIGNELVPPPSGPGPVVSDKAHPYVSNELAQRTGQQPNLPVADLSNPLLQPWVVAALRRQNEETLAGKPTFTRWSRCWPTGVPAFLLNPVLPIYFLQTPHEVWMVLELGHRVRRVALNQKHSSNPQPSWYGNSVGHYEGDTLVVDTIGFIDRSYLDHFRTPHTGQLHVVERFRMIDGGQVLEVNITVEDPGAFTTAWSAIRRFRRVEARPLREMVCAENNEKYFDLPVEPIPTDNTPDF